MNKIHKLVGTAIFTAIVVVLQLLGGGIHFSMFSITLVLVPVVIGAAVFGWQSGAWLGFTFGVAVLLTGDAAPFYAVDPIGTVITVLMKGLLCGLAAGLTYRALSKLNRTVAVIAAAIVCPIVNTGVFLLGCLVFFMDTLAEWAVIYGFPNAGNYMIYGLVGVNFLVELAVNLILAPTVTRIIQLAKR